jgi:homocysteine S-methyltransferase
MAQSPAPPILLLDGGLGTSLEDLHGVEFSEKTPLWSGHLLISSPRMLQELHSAFAAAGADVIETATYQTSFAGFSKTPRTDSDSGEVGYSRDEAEHYMRTAVAIARRAIDSSARQDNVLLALSLGPLGATLTPSAEFTGAYPVQYADWQGLHAFHDERLRVFAHDAATWALVDVVAFETLPVAREVRAVREGMARLQREGLGRPYWVACVFREDLTLPDGSKVAEVVREMLAP